ncbi:MAG: hypothetical protein HZB37_04585 [Planctomycetes bacterium]|nr:hypothetical protein [Planctomycetota bacterium]
MKHIKRRYEAGKMLMDVTKYLLTIGLIGGVITNKITSLSAVFIIVSVIILFAVAYFTIPPDKEERS